MARWKTLAALSTATVLMLSGCGDDEPKSTEDDEPVVLVEGDCQIDAEDEAPDFLEDINCRDDFDALASAPLDASLSGATSLKVVLDVRQDPSALYFQNSTRYRIHFDFASENLSGGDFPLVPPLAQFNDNYYAPPEERQFVLGAVTYYSGPDVWTLEFAPYDTATADAVELLFDAVRDHAYFGPALTFHANSQAFESVAEDLPDDIPVITTDEIYAGTDYQALNPGEAVGRLRFLYSAELESAYVGPCDIVVLDKVPNDISVVAGIVTQEFQTPLSHINVLSQNRGTPNMGLRGAMQNEELREHEDSYVRLIVGNEEFTVEAVSAEEAEEAQRECVARSGAEVSIARYDTTEDLIQDIEDLVDMDTFEPDPEDPRSPLAQAIAEQIPAYGGKAAHYSWLAQIADRDSGGEWQVPKAFAIPVHYYAQFMAEHHFDDDLEDMFANPAFNSDPAVREELLGELRRKMRTSNVDRELLNKIRNKIWGAGEYLEDGRREDWEDNRMRFRSSTNAEDLAGFTGAGLYTSVTARVDRAWVPRDGDEPGHYVYIDDPERTIEDALRTVWSSVWYFRAYEERSYRGIDHRNVGMALLVHPSFPDEEANGVALTANPFDVADLEPAFYINAQLGGVSVVLPSSEVTVDQFIYYHDLPNQPTVYLSHSNLIEEGSTVLTRREIYTLGNALSDIHDGFSEAYGPAAGNLGYYAMDTEWKYDGRRNRDGLIETPQLYVKQARPHTERGSE